MEVSEASDISGFNELSRRKAAQDGLRVGGLVGPSVMQCLVRASLALSVVQILFCQG